tara:strand:- start:391 stop:999 length:609 start_codon:yes stop_codon:yes gene_type:complete
MANLRPFRDYDEKDVINLFALDTATNVDGFPNLSTSWDGRVTKGTLVQLSSAGWHNDDELSMLESAGTLDPQNVTSQRYGVKAKVEIADANGPVIGMLLHDVAVVDENGEQLKYNPRKASELEAVIPGQAVPIVTRGIFLLESAALAAETFNAGASLTVANNGEWTSLNIGTSDTIVGTTLGNNPASGNLVLVQLDITPNGN